jgi:serine/threonine-protein kinase
VKVLDFGLAKLLEGKQLTAAGTAVGTVAYMAPEQVVADPTDARTDVYGLGVVMYRALAGVLPFVSKDQAIMLASHLIVEPPEPRARVAALDPSTCAVVKKALRKLPENRYASMRELRDDIDRLTKRRDGELVANAPLAKDPDLYVPRHAFSRSAAGYFYKKLGSSPPFWK